MSKAYGTTPAERARILADQAKAEYHRATPKITTRRAPAIPPTAIDGTIRCLDAGVTVPIEALHLAQEFMSRFPDVHPYFQRTAALRREWVRRCDLVGAAIVRAFG